MIYFLRVFKYCDKIIKRQKLILQAKLFPEIIAAGEYYLVINACNALQLRVIYAGKKKADLIRCLHDVQ